LGKFGNFLFWRGETDSPGGEEIGHPDEYAKPLRSYRCATNNLTDRKGVLMSMTVHVDDKATGEIELEVEEMEEVIAPKLAVNHNETLVRDEVELSAEEMEEVIAPKLATNHNETLVSDEVELSAEEVEELIAPKIATNHNETLDRDEVE
jgi:hypothetical protein